MVRLRQAKSVLAMLLLLGGLSNLWSVRVEPLRDAAHLMRVFEGSERGGALIIGIIETSDDDRVDDPDYLWPDRFVSLERVIEGARTDDEGDSHWESKATCAPFEPRSFRAHASRVGDLRFSLSEASFLGAPLISIDTQAARVEKARTPPVAFEPAFAGFYAEPSTTKTPSYDLTRNGVTKDVACLLTYRAIRSGDRVTIVGARRGNELLPWQWRAEQPAKVWVLTGERSSKEVAAALADDATPLDHEAMDRERGDCRSGLVDAVRAVARALSRSLLVWHHLARHGFLESREDLRDARLRRTRGLRYARHRRGDTERGRAHPLACADWLCVRLGAK